MDGWYVTYTNWYSSYPYSDDCVVLDNYYYAEWRTLSCISYSYPYMCKTTTGRSQLLVYINELNFERKIGLNVSLVWSSTEDPITLPPVALGKCPDPPNSLKKWVEHDDNCYMPFNGYNEQADWLTALQTCLQLDVNANLVSVHHTTTNSWLFDLIKQGSYAGSRMWLGMHRSKGITV